MAGIHARRNIAAMTDTESYRNGPVEKLPCQSVCGDLFLAIP